ncbi:hypothetical protein Tco_0981511 [Tanacetum coccineum]
MSQEIVHIAVNSVDSLDVKKSCVNECNKCLELETELLKKKDLIKKDFYDKLSKSYSTLEKHCISLELTTQLNQEIFQKDNFFENQNAHTFNHLFEINEMKAQSQEKDTVIRKLKDRIKSLSGKDSVENVKKDIDEIEMIIIVSKEQSTSLIDQINAKSIENSDLNAQLQKKVFAIATLKNELWNLKGKINKFKEDKIRVLLVLETEELLQPQGETMQLVKQRLRSVITVWGKDIWRNSALSQRSQEVLHEDPRIAEVQVAHQTIPQNSAFQTEDLDAYDSDYDDISLAKAVLMENLSSYDSDFLSEE